MLNTEIFKSSSVFNVSDMMFESGMQRMRCGDEGRLVRNGNGSSL